jgi:hypothetical protein
VVCWRWAKTNPLTRRRPQARLHPATPVFPGHRLAGPHPGSPRLESGGGGPAASGDAGRTRALAPGAGPLPRGRGGRRRRPLHLALARRALGAGGEPWCPGSGALQAGDPRGPGPTRSDRRAADGGMAPRRHAAPRLGLSRCRAGPRERLRRRMPRRRPRAARLAHRHQTTSQAPLPASGTPQAATAHRAGLSGGGRQPSPSAWPGTARASARPTAGAPLWRGLAPRPPRPARRTPAPAGARAPASASSGPWGCGLRATLVSWAPAL